MTLLAVPNISEGKNPELLAELERLARTSGARVLDVHADPVHNRSVFTLTGTSKELLNACVALAGLAASRIDLSHQGGVHPRLGAMDICPFVPHDSEMSEAVALARETAVAIGTSVGLPVYLYGHAATPARALPDLRRGGIEALRERALDAMPPDAGPRSIDPRRGVVCVGARGPLIAFNVWIEAEVEHAQTIARSVRGPTIRALGFPISTTESQVSMNLVEPEITGIEEAFAAVSREAEHRGVEISGTELVGLVAERFLPSPDATVTRLLKQPGHSLEASLQSPD